MVCERNTIQKEKIFKYLSSVETHPTAETVFNEVRKEIPSITLATVYRNLNKLAEQGCVHRLELNGEYHFDGRQGMHQHGVCRKCGKIIDFIDSEISKNALKKINSADFEAEDVTIIYSGVCKECKYTGRN